MSFWLVEARLYINLTLNVIFLVFVHMSQRDLYFFCRVSHPPKRDIATMLSQQQQPH